MKIVRIMIISVGLINKKQTRKIMKTRKGKNVIKIIFPLIDRFKSTLVELGYLGRAACSNCSFDTQNRLKQFSRLNMRQHGCIITLPYLAHQVPRNLDQCMVMHQDKLRGRDVLPPPLWSFESMRE